MLLKLNPFYLISYVYWIFSLLLSFIASTDCGSVICIKLDRKYRIYDSMILSDLNDSAGIFLSDLRLLRGIF